MIPYRGHRLETVLGDTVPRETETFTLKPGETAWQILMDSSERDSDGARHGWCVVGEARTWREAAVACNARYGTRIPTGPSRPLVIGDTVRHSDSESVGTIPAYRALRGRVVGVRGSVIEVHWTCDATPSLIGVAEVTEVGPD